MDFPIRVRRMPGGVTFGNGGNELLTQILRHPLDVRQPGGAQPRGKTVAPAISRILRRQPDAEGFETKARQPFFISLRRVKKIRPGYPPKERAPAAKSHFRTQRHENVLCIAAATARNDKPAAGLQARRRPAQKCLMVIHPMQRGVGKYQMKPAVKLILRASMT
jgi:hypothetical protein